MQLQGSSTQITIGFESSYGVASSTGYIVPFAPTLNASTNQAINSSAVITGNASPSQPFLGFKDGAVSGSFPVDDKAMAQWLKGLFGSPTTVDNFNGTYTHTYKIGKTIPSMFMEVNHSDVGAGLYYTTVGIGLNTLSFSIGGDGELLATIEGIAKDTTKSTTSTVTASDYTDGVKFGQFQAAITGATNVKTFDLNYSNAIDGDTYIIDGTGSRNGVPKGIAEVGGSFTTLFEDDSIFASARSFTDFPLDATFTSGTSILKFDMQEAKLDAVTNPEIAGAAGIIASFNFQAYLASGSNDTALQVELTNTLATV